MRAITRRPTRPSSVAAVLVGLLGLVIVTPYSTVSLALSGVGFVGLVAGLAVDSRTLVTLGPVGLFAGAVAAGAGNAPVALTLCAILAAVLAYDFGATAVDLGAQLGQEADTRRLELIRLATSSFVGCAIGGVSYLVYVVGTGGQPLSAVVAMLLAVVVLFVALRRQEPAG